MRIADLRQSGNVRQGGTHHSADDRPSCGYSVAGEVLQQVGHTDIVRPASHLDNLIAEREVEAPPAELHVQTDDNGRFCHLNRIASQKSRLRLSELGQPTAYASAFTGTSSRWLLNPLQRRL